LTDSID